MNFDKQVIFCGYQTPQIANSWFNISDGKILIKFYSHWLHFVKLITNTQVT